MKSPAHQPNVAQGWLGHGIYHAASWGVEVTFSERHQTVLLTFKKYSLKRWWRTVLSFRTSRPPHVDSVSKVHIKSLQTVSLYFLSFIVNTVNTVSFSKSLEAYEKNQHWKKTAVYPVRMILITAARSGAQRLIPKSDTYCRALSPQFFILSLDLSMER